MNFGIFTQFPVREGVTTAEVFDEWFGLARAAEDMGFDMFWLGEIHFRPEFAVLASPMIGASAIAARTSRIGIGLAVQVLPLANPLRVAEEAAMVDQISKGRLIFGVGRSSFLDSYEGYNIDYADSRAMFLESMEVIQRAWREESFSFAGKYYRFQNVKTVPKPYQLPGPPVRVAVESRDTFAMVGKLGFPIFIRHQLSIEELQRLLSEYEEERHAAGHPGPNDVILQAPVYVAETAEKARTEPQASTMRRMRILRQMSRYIADPEAQQRLGRMFEVSYEDTLRRVVYGTPEEVAERLAEYRETLGVTGFSLELNPGGQIPYERVINSMRLLAEKVIPQFK
jgi:alkanesulfonate monooxygenase SsuD/methylene tetrahydromethanopterin reductase-like flavin-dependent oxidoreductase (luciferase family)